MEVTANLRLSGPAGNPGFDPGSEGRSCFAPLTLVSVVDVIVDVRRTVNGQELEAIPGFFLVSTCCTIEQE